MHPDHAPKGRNQQCLQSTPSTWITAWGSDIDMLRDTVRGFASEKIAPRAAEIDEKEQPSD